jgi:recombination protein RecA
MKMSAHKKKVEKKKADHAQAVLGIIHKQLGKGSVSLLRDGLQAQTVEQVMPTGIEVFDNYLSGIGGLPTGRVIELFSEEGGGKTSMGYSFLAAAQRAGGLAALWDSEQAFDSDRAQIFGVNTADLLLAQPDHIEELLEGVEAFLLAVEGRENLGPSVIVWDSIASASTKAEFEEGFDTKEHAAKKAAAMSRAMRIIGPRIKKSKVCMVCINQLRQNVGVVFGNKDTTPGGKAVKYHASIRIQLMGGKAVKDNKTGDHIAKVITVLIVKSRFSQPYRKALLRLDYATGWNNPWSTLSHAKDRHVIAKETKMSTKAYKESIAALGWDIPENIETANALIEEGSTDDEESEATDSK